jgi:hypothetical protein
MPDDIQIQNHILNELNEQRKANPRNYQTDSRLDIEQLCNSLRIDRNAYVYHAGVLLERRLVREPSSDDLSLDDGYLHITSAGISALIEQTIVDLGHSAKRQVRQEPGTQVRVLRLVVASLSDVQPERTILADIVAELNRTVATARGLRLDLIRWETDAFPAFHPQGPQGHIDSLLRIEDSDLLIGIFWRRFGTPVAEAGSGTEHEFRTAYAAWKRKGTPQIMLYFNQRAGHPATSEAATQLQRVLKFRESLPKEGLWWPYRSRAEFERLAREHLTKFLLSGSRGSEAGPQDGTARRPSKIARERGTPLPTPASAARRRGSTQARVAAPVPDEATLRERVAGLIPTAVTGYDPALCIALVLGPAVPRVRA